MAPAKPTRSVNVNKPVTRSSAKSTNKSNNTEPVQHVSKRTRTTARNVKQSIPNADQQKNPVSIIKRVDYNSTHQASTPYRDRQPYNEEPSTSNNGFTVSPRDITILPSNTNNPARIISRRISNVTEISEIRSFHQNDDEDQNDNSAPIESDLRNKFDRIVNDINEDFQNFSDPEFDQATSAHCKMRMNMLDGRKAQLAQVYNQLLDANDLSCNYPYGEAILTADSAKQYLVDRLSELQEISANNSIHTMHQNSINPQTLRIEFDQGQLLAPLPLPKFDGDYTKWTEFKAQFTNRVHNSTKMQDTDKLYRLKASVEGSAAIALGMWQLIPENYSKAWNKLCDIYDNEYLMVRSHIQDILNINQLTESSGENLRYILDTVSNSMDQLNSLNANIAELIIMQLMESKLDPETLKEWEMSRHHRNVPTFSEFSLFLDKRVRLLSNKLPTTITIKEKKSDVKGTIKSIKENVRVQPYPSGRFNQFSRQNMPPSLCRLCKADHGLFKCPTFLAWSIPIRQSKVKEWGLCVSCLRSHKGRCFKPRVCYLCENMIHNSVLCPKGVVGAMKVHVHAITNEEAEEASKHVTLDKGVINRGE